jgi:hypothetical protein
MGAMLGLVPPRLGSGYLGTIQDLNTAEFFFQTAQDLNGAEYT